MDTLKYEYNLFKTANKLRGKIPPSDYKFYVLPLVFLRYISLKNEETIWMDLYHHKDDERICDRLDGYLTSVLYADKEAEKVYENIYTESKLPSKVISDLICLIDEIPLETQGKKIDYLGQIYEYFIHNFASTEGNRGGEYFTPPSVVDLLVKMLEPKSGTIYDPACGTGGMFVQSDKYCRKHLQFVGQEQNYKTILLAKMNAVLHDLDITIFFGDTLLHDGFPELKADIIISNPPFNMKEWGAEELKKDDPRIFEKVNPNNANYMWIQHFMYHLKENGMAGFVISNGALTSSQSADQRTRRKLLEMNVIDCVVQLPDKMFLGTAIPSALIFLNKNRKDKKKILFIDAEKRGVLVNKTQKQFSAEDIDTISCLYHDFKKNIEKDYNKKGFSWAADVQEVLQKDCKIMPSLYTGVEEEEIDPVANAEMIKELEKALILQIEISERLGKEICRELKA